MTMVYVYVLDTLADWELGNVTAELNSGRFFKKDAPATTLKTISYSGEPIKTMGGLTVVPDGTVDEIVVDKANMLLLPGADTWGDPKHSAVIEKAGELLSAEGTVGAICGATVALANAGLLDNRTHTSNGPGFLEMMSPDYKGQSCYEDTPSITDGSLITASVTGSLLWAKHIIGHLGVFRSSTLEAWYAYFSTGNPQQFYTLMESLPSSSEN